MTIETKLTDAMIYRSGCVVIRKGKVTLAEGKNELLIRGLSSGTDERTVRLSLPVGVRGSNVQTRALTEEEKEELVKELRMKVEELQAKSDLLTEQVELWKANADFTAKTSLDIKDVTDYLEKLPDRIAGLRAEVRRLNEERAKLQKELNDKKPRLLGKVLTAEVECEKAGTYPVEVRYHDANAFWNPVYEIHSEGEGSDLLLRLRAKIRQGTGEDWQNVRLSLYTGNPSLSGTIPTLMSSHLRIHEPVKYMAAGSAMRKNAFMAMAAPMAVEEECEACDTMEDTMEMDMSAVVNATAEVNQGETMTEYDLPGTWELVNRRDVMADLTEESIKAEYHIVTVPKLDEAAYLAAEVKVADLENILQTEAAVYLKGTYAGNVYVNPDSSKETYDLSLGRDESVKTKRVQKRRHTSTVLLKGQKKTEYEYEVSVSSRKDKDCRVTVWDQIPVSDDKTITVEKTEISGGKLDAETGKLRYDFDLPAGKTQTMKIAYSIAWPKDKSFDEFNVND